MNELGPLQLYVAPTIVFAVKLIVPLAHNGELLPGTTAAGKGVIITFTVPIGLAQPKTVALTEYIPADKEVVATIVGF